MATKIQITITPDTEYLPHDQIDAAMARTLRLLAADADVPTRKLTLVAECADDDAERFKDAIHAALSGRPVGIEAVLKTTCEEHVARTSVPRTTPMDAYLRDQVERVELSAHGRTVELTAQTARNAAAMLQDAPVGSDAPPRR